MIKEQKLSEYQKVQEEKEFDTEFCNVKYVENDNAVFLTWKKFACLDDYRKPTQFALKLLGKYKNSNFIVDARHGFEDDKRDVDWGISYLLPEMAKTTCKYVAFILNKVNNPDLDMEMDLWTLAFGRYFAVTKTTSYEDAVSSIGHAVSVQVVYTVKPGQREAFLQAVKAARIIDDSREEPGNIKYQYYLPIDSEQDIFLLEMWTNQAAQKYHGSTIHYNKLTDLKKKYIVNVRIKKYVTQEVSGQ